MAQQENFEAARSAAQNTLKRLGSTIPVLDTFALEQLESMAWDLEALASTLRAHIAERDPQGPVDLG